MELFSIRIQRTFQLVSTVIDKTNHAHIELLHLITLKQRDDGQSTKQEVETGTDVPCLQKKTGANGSILMDANSQ